MSEWQKLTPFWRGWVRGSLAAMYLFALFEGAGIGVALNSRAWGAAAMWAVIGIATSASAKYLGRVLKEDRHA